MAYLHEILDISPPKLNIIDLGARIPGGETASYESQFLRIPGNHIGRLYGFEPDEPTCRELNEKTPAHYTFLPYAVFDGSPQHLYLTESPLVSSLYEPDMEMRVPFGDLAKVARVKEVIEVNTARLDDIPEIDEPIDLIKADVQGAENVIFKNASRVLSATLVIQTEVFLIPLYKNMPLSGDVDRTLNDMGFLNHRLWGSQGRSFVPLSHPKGYSQPLSQFTAQDVVYVKHWLKLKEQGLSDVSVLKFATILHDCYKSIDLVHFILQEYDMMAGARHAPRYLKHVTGNSQTKES